MYKKQFDRLTWSHPANFLINELKEIMKHCEQQFTLLSKELTGFDDLMTEIVDAHYKSMQLLDASGKLGTPGIFNRLLERYIFGQAKDLYEEPENLVFLKEIILLWYTGFPSSNELTKIAKIELDGYFESLLWKVIRAHPPGLSLSLIHI